MPCDKKFGEPNVKDVSGEISPQFRFTRSGRSKTKPLKQSQSHEQSTNEVFSESEIVNHDLVVKTKTGFVEGYPMKTINGREIYAFEGTFSYQKDAYHPLDYVFIALSKFISILYFCRNKVC